MERNETATAKTSGERDLLADMPLTVEAINCEMDRASVAAEGAIREYWASLSGTLRYLNLKREAIVERRVPLAGSGWVKVSQSDEDPAPWPSALALRAGRGIEFLAQADAPPDQTVTVVNGLAVRLRPIALTWAPWRSRRSEDRSHEDGRGFANSTARVARECIEWGLAALPGSPDYAGQYAEVGIALPADLEGRTAAHHRASVNVELPRLLVDLANAEDLPSAYRTSARHIAEGRASPDAILTAFESVTDLAEASPDSASVPSAPSSTLPDDLEVAERDGILALLELSATSRSTLVPAKQLAYRLFKSGDPEKVRKTIKRLRGRRYADTKPGQKKEACG